MGTDMSNEHQNAVLTDKRSELTKNDMSLKSEFVLKELEAGKFKKIGSLNVDYSGNKKH